MKKLILAAFFLIISVSIISCGSEEKKPTTLSQPEQTKTTPSDNTPPKVGQIWKSIDEKTAALDAIIKGGKYEHLHESREIVTLVQSLTSRSQSLGEAKLNSLRSLTSEMSKSSMEIDELSHNNKKSEIPAAFEKFKNQIDRVKALYPSESFN